MASPHFYPTYGGAQNRYRQYIPGFAERGLDVQLLTGTPLPEERSEADTQLDEWYEEEPGAYLPTTRLGNTPLERIRLPDGKGRMRTEIYYNALLDVCSRDAPGAVVAQLLTNLRPEALPWIEQLNRAGVATLYSVSQFPAWPSKPTKRWFRGSGYRKVYDAFDALVTNSPAIADLLREMGVSTRIEYIPSGVNLKRFRPADTDALLQERAALRASLGIPEGHRVLATVGAIMPRKGPDIALEAWRRILKQHPDTHMLFVGPRADQFDRKLAGFANRIDRLISTSGAESQVHFTGLVDNVESWLRAADIFVLPTQREGTPNSVLEAMASGLPAVVTRFVGLSDAIGEPGIHYQLVDRNARALSAALATLLRDSTEYSRMRAAGLDYVRSNMDQQLSLDRYVALYRDLGERALLRQRHDEAITPAELKPLSSPLRGRRITVNTGYKPPLLILGAPPRGGNHLLRGLLDNHSQLLLPPDEDYFIRHLSRHPLQRLRGLLVSRQQAPAYFRQLQKDGHLERVNAGHGTEVFGTEDSLNLDAYYRYVSEHHLRFSPDSLVRNHVEAMAVALGHQHGDERLRVCFCALQPSNKDLTRVSNMLARSYDVSGIFLVRDPRAHLASKLVRNPSLDLGRYCARQNRYWSEIEEFTSNFQRSLRLRFEDLVTDTEATMRLVCEFAGIEYYPELLNYTQGGEVSQSNSSFAASPGIDRGVLSRYRESLAPATIAYLEKHCRPELFWRDSAASEDLREHSY